MERMAFFRIIHSYLFNCCFDCLARSFYEDLIWFEIMKVLVQFVINFEHLMNRYLQLMRNLLIGDIIFKFHVHNLCCHISCGGRFSKSSL